mmetsp:Transcript_17941/g.41057  ORF Transcript_17941/g.41057 Transcript_17941/m.41057 type:complete len:216 (+) Transcript_17941:425-1072(+)
MVRAVETVAHLEDAAAQQRREAHGQLYRWVRRWVLAPVVELAFEIATDPVAAAAYQQEIELCAEVAQLAQLTQLAQLGVGVGLGEAPASLHGGTESDADATVPLQFGRRPSNGKGGGKAGNSKMARQGKKRPKRKKGETRSGKLSTVKLPAVGSAAAEAGSRTELSGCQSGGVDHGNEAGGFGGLEATDPTRATGANVWRVGDQCVCFYPGDYLW